MSSTNLQNMLIMNNQTFTFKKDTICNSIKRYEILVNYWRKLNWHLYKSLKSLCIKLCVSLRNFRTIKIKKGPDSSHRDKQIIYKGPENQTGIRHLNSQNRIKQELKERSNIKFSSNTARSWWTLLKGDKLPNKSMTYSIEIWSLPLEGL